MKSPVFKTSAFGKHVTAEIRAQEVTQNGMRSEGQRRRPRVALGQPRQAHGRRGATLRVKQRETGRMPLCHADRPETSV